MFDAQLKRAAKPGQNAAIEELQVFVEENKPLSTKSKESRKDEKHGDKEENDDFEVEEEESDAEEEEEKNGKEDKDKSSKVAKETVVKPANGTKRESSIDLKQEKRVRTNDSDFSLEEDSILESRSKKRTVVLSDSDQSVSYYITDFHCFWINRITQQTT